MLQRRVRHGALIGILALLGAHLWAQEIDARGQASAIARFNRDSLDAFQGSLRYIPSIFVNMPLGEFQSMDGEASVDIRVSGTARQHERPATESSLKPYRAWLRYATSRFEIRAGLQKISFGSASLFRPLMWFDAIDPRDPLQITKGVYALLGRFYAATTTNFWIWGIYGQDETRGWEVLASRKGSMEIGGRFQIPLFLGETGLTYHHRTAELRLPDLPGMGQQQLTFPEDRIGIDGKWDVGPGVWVEATLTRQQTAAITLPWQHALTVGADYTIGLGNGLTILAECFLQSSAEQGFGSGPTVRFAGLTFAYPVTIIDDASAFLYYDQVNSEAYLFASWRRTYDNWVFHLMAFANPRRPGFIASQNPAIALSGQGAMLMVVFNH